MLSGKRCAVLCAAAAWGLLFGVPPLIRNLNSDAEWEREQRQFICGYPPYLQLHPGLNQRDVERLLGVPTQRTTLPKAQENAFGQGALGRRIREEWTYQVQGWNGHVEVYFDARGRVIGTGCGNG